MIKLSKECQIISSIVVLLFSAVPVGAFYNPSQGRWLSRDPISDDAFIIRLAIDEEVPSKESDLYSFLRNATPKRTDFLGLFSNFIDCDCCQVEGLRNDEGVAQTHIANLKTSIQAVLPDILANPARYRSEKECP